MLHFNTFYGIIALITSAIIVIKLLLSAFLGEFDLDGDCDVDSGGGDFDAGMILSPKGIISFLFGGSWYLVLAEYVRTIPPKSLDYLIAIGVGLVCSICIALVYWGMAKLSCEKKQETGDTLVGRSVEIYLNLDTNYEVFVTINGAKRRLIVHSKSGKIYKSGDVSHIIEFVDGKYYIE